LVTWLGLSSDDQSAGYGCRAFVAEALAEQQETDRDDINAMVVKVVATTLASFGIDEDDRKELRSDFQHLRRWRRGIEQAQSYAFKAIITVNLFLRLERVGSSSKSTRVPWPKVDRVFHLEGVPPEPEGRAQDGLSSRTIAAHDLLKSVER
jgi:hypothetical protein